MYSAPAFQVTNTAQYLDVSASVLSYQRIERAGKPGRLEVLLDNAKGVYNGLVTAGSTYRPIGLNASMVLSEGYKVGSPPTTPDVVKVGVYHIEQIHFKRSPQENQVLLVGLDLLHAIYMVTIPLNPALQMLDGIILTDSVAPTGSGQSTPCRIIHLLAHYDAQHGVYELQLVLEGV